LSGAPSWKGEVKQKFSFHRMLSSQKLAVKPLAKTAPICMLEASPTSTLFEAT
jgi:hypothetical protein